MADIRQKPVLSVRVEERLIDRIDALARATELSRAEIVERALSVGLEDQEKFVASLQGVVTGPLMELLASEKFLNVLMALTRDEADPNQLKALRNVRGKKKRGGVQGRPATE